MARSCDPGPGPGSGIAGRGAEPRGAGGGPEEGRRRSPPGRAGRSAEALRLFREAYDLHQNPGYLYNMGIAHQALGEDVQALAMFERFLQDARNVAPEFIADAVAQSREIKRRVAVVEVSCSQEGAQVTLDGQEIGRTPLRSLHTRGGSHLIEVSKPGFVTFQRGFTAQPGGQVVIEAVMRPVPAPRSTVEMEPAVRLPPPTERVAARAEPEPRGGLDLDAMVGVQWWVSGLSPKPDPSLALRLSAGYVPAALDGGRLALRLGATAGLSFLSESRGQVYFTSLLATPGVRAAFTPALYGALDFGPGRCGSPGIQEGSVLIAPGGRVTARAHQLRAAPLPGPRLRPGQVPGPLRQRLAGLEQPARPELPGRLLDARRDRGRAALEVLRAALAQSLGMAP